MRLPWAKPAARPLHFCANGGCGNIATHDRLVETPAWIVGDYLFAWLCDDCDQSPKVATPTGVWTALDPVSPEEFEEDRAQLPANPSKYANNLVLHSGRTWRWTEQ